MKGVDVSSWQAGFDFARAKEEGYDFAIVKISGGISYVNEYADRQLYNALQAGMLVGVYHYMIEPSYPQGNGTEEAQHFLRQYDRYKQYAPTIWNDLEEPAFNLQARIDAWYDAVSNQTGAPEIGVYSGTYFWRGQNLDVSRYKSLWLASWQDALPEKQFYEQHDRVSVWQYDSRATAGGMFPIDANNAYMSAADWLTMGGSQSLQNAPIVSDPWGELKLPFGPHKVTVHPFFHGTYKLDTWGWPVGPAVDYTDGRIRQAFENGCFGSSGRDEPRPEGSTFAYAQASGQTLGKVVYDFPDVHPLLP